MADQVTVQVVDDHFLFASSLASVIKEIERYRVVGIAVTGPQALAMVREEHPDIVLLDFHLPGYSADMLIPRFLAVSPATRVIVLTSDTSDAAMMSSLRAGATGFMTKDKAIDDVLEALTIVADGGTLLTARQLEIARAAAQSHAPPASATLPRSAPEAMAAPTSLTFAPAPLPRIETLELRLVGIGSFAQAVLIERFIDRLPQVEQVYIRDLGGDRASLRVALQPGTGAEGLAKELIEGSRRLRLTGAERGMLELQVEAPLIDG